MLKGFILILVLWAFPLFGVTAGTVPLDFESGDRNLDINQCWANTGITYDKNNKVTGKWSGLTGSLASISPNNAFLKAPWVIAEAGSITFKVKLNGGTATTRYFTVSIVPYSSSSGNKEGTPVVIFTYQYATARESTTRNFSLAMPSEYIGTGEPCRVLITFYGTGGSGRAYLDDISIPGTNHSNPSSNCLPLAPLTDRDGDGVDNENDAYPDDRYRALNNYFPSETTYGTLLFEDMWPSRGDYDFNDMVLSYRINSITNGANQVVEQEYTLTIRALGAWYHNGFGFQLTNVNPASVLHVTGTDVSTVPYPVPNTQAVTEYHFESNGLESGQTHPTVIVFEDGFRIMSGTGTVASYMNTDPNLVPVAPKTLNVKVVFMENGVAGSGGAVTLNQLTMPFFNPFMVSNGDRRREIHQANFTPTDLAVTTVFGMIDDASVPAEGKYYITPANHPWVLNIPYEIPYSLEEVQFDFGYLKFLDWAVSGGVNYPDWYMDKPGYRNDSALY